MQLFLLLLPLALACKRTTLTTTTTQPPPPTTTRTTTTPTTTATTSSTSPTPTTATPRHLDPRPAGNSTTLVTTIPTNATQPTESSNTTTTQAPIDCPDGWIDETAVGLGCLRFVEEPGGLNWLETQTTCQSDIGSSVEALNMDEAEKLFEIAQLTSFFSHREVWWLGLSDLVSEGRWIWSHSYDVKVNTSMYSDIWTPTNITTDPGNANDCVVMTVGNNSQLIWKDIPCLSVEYDSKPIQAVCQCKGDDCPRFVPTVATVATPPAPHDCPVGWLYSGPGFGCIIPLTDQKDLSSQEAEAACLDVGGYLVEPRSENREKHLKDIAEILYNVGFAWSWWLGLSFRESESEDGEQWLWTSDDGVLNPNITYWGSGEGNGTNGGSCAILAKLGVSWEWHQVDCVDSDFRGKNIGAICQECLGKDCPSTPAKATTTTTTTTTTTPMTTFAKPDDCVTNSDGACLFLSTTEVFVSSPK